MGIKNLIQWIKQNFHECSSRANKESKQCDTLYIDAFQLFFDAERNAKDHKSFIKNYTRSIQSTIFSFNPNQTIFIFLDGPCPAIKLQKLRERWFRCCHIENFVIDSEEPPIEETSEEDDDENPHISLEKCLKKLINYATIKANSIVYSSVSVPGEAKFKFVQSFQEKKKVQQTNC